MASGSSAKKIRMKNTEYRIENIPAKSFDDLIMWKKAHQFVLAVYGYTENFPRQEMYGLVSQLRRAAVSIPANIAEGFKKKGKLDKARFLNIAQGSAEECRYYLILATDLKYGDCSTLRTLLDEVSKLIYAYSKSILSSVS
jgi:four helix bundle protein